MVWHKVKQPLAAIRTDTPPNNTDRVMAFVQFSCRGEHQHPHLAGMVANLGRAHGNRYDTRFPNQELRVYAIP